MPGTLGTRSGAGYPAVMFLNALFVGLLSTSGVVPDGDATWTLQLSTDITRAQAPVWYWAT